MVAAGQAEAAVPGEDDGERKQPGGGIKRALPAARPAVSMAAWRSPSRRSQGKRGRLERTTTVWEHMGVSAVTVGEGGASLAQRLLVD